MTPKISVLMPTYNFGHFILRALRSLMNQEFAEWELLIIDDGSTDGTEDIVGKNYSDPRIRYIKNIENKGLGYSLNVGLAECHSDLIAYLPADDVIFANHLSSLYEKICGTDYSYAYTGILYNYQDTSSASGANETYGKIRGFCYQLVQILHKKVNERWIERDEIVTWDLDFMFWNKLDKHGAAVETSFVTAEWVNHPHQRFKLINESLGGGISTYKNFYKVDIPIKFVGSGNFIDEIKLAENLKKRRPEVKKSVKKLKILFVGELSFNPERILAFEERGHALFGLWIKPSGFLCSISPFPYSNLVELKDPQEISVIQPDIIYSLLNHSAISLAHSVLHSFPDIPFVWHFKESPFFCRQKGEWNLLMDLYNLSDGRVYLNRIYKEWFDQFTDPKNDLNLVLDGDLPSEIWFTNNKSKKISSKDNSCHTVIVGRPYGISLENMQELARQKIHIHFYGNYQQSLRSSWISAAKDSIPDFFHLHNNCDSSEWVEEFSKYDAGWLHIFDSNNHGELLRANWNDLNFPARLPTLLSAGLPVLFKYKKGNYSATQQLLEELNIGIFFNTFGELGEILSDNTKISAIRNNAWKIRNQFTFDYHVDNLIDFFSSVIEAKRQF